MKKQSLLIIMLAIWILLLTACGGATGNSGQSGPPESKEGSAKSSTGYSGDGSTSSFPRTITDATGEVTIKKQPKKVALVHWGLSDVMLTFDLDTVAITLPFTAVQSVLKTDVYKPFVDKHREIAIVGENTGVNMEAVLAYEPDLIIAGSSTNKNQLGQLGQIAQTIVIDEAKTNVFEDWKAVMTQFGRILGQEENAKAFVAAFDQQTQEAKAKLAGVGGTVVFVQVREKNMWLSSPTTLSLYYEGLGLKPPEAPMMKEGGQLSLEGLSQLNPDHLFLGHFNYEDPTLPAVTDEWEKSEVWKKLKAVQQGQTYPFNGQLALGFGPIGKAYGIDAIVKAVKKP
ncbi:MAG: iron transporter substrate-binding protein [Paenibacillus sp.]|nr:iron transporter substrate-binding protein [Paenibacillus sp.]